MVLDAFFSATAPPEVYLYVGTSRLIIFEVDIFQTQKYANSSDMIQALKNRCRDAQLFEEGRLVSCIIGRIKVAEAYTNQTESLP